MFSVIADKQGKIGQNMAKLSDKGYLPEVPHEQAAGNFLRTREPDERAPHE
jgi:hypothetical protein